MRYSLMELHPNNGRKSFYGKATVLVDIRTGTQTLISYHTPIARMKGGSSRHVERLCDEDSLTRTSRVHLKSFCGLHKDAFLLLPLKKPTAREQEC